MIYRLIDKEAYLMHYGVKGMKWGVRKDRNSGSLMGRLHRNSAKAVQRDIDSFKKHRNGLHTKSGKEVVSAKEVSDTIKGLEQVRNKSLRKAERADRRAAHRREKIRTMLNVTKNYTGSRGSNALKAARSKDINKMSNQELQDTINRLNLERNYRSLTRVDYMRGQKYAADALKYETTYNAVKKSNAVKRGKKALATAYVSTKLATGTP